MFIRAITGIVLGGALSTAALYGAYTYLGLSAHQPGLGALVEDDEAAPAEAADIEPGEPESESAEAEFEGEPPLALPYGEGERAAAMWLFEVLTGTGPHQAQLNNGDATVEVDLADLAARAAWPQPERPAQPQLNDEVTTHDASCQASHVMLACSVETGTAVWYSESSDGDHWTVASSQAYRFSMQQDADGDWVIVPGSIGLHVAG